MRNGGKNRKKIQGFYLIIAIILMVVIGFMGAIIAQLFSNQGLLGAITINGFRSFYIAESGIEVGSRLLTIPAFTGSLARIGCSAISAYAPVQNASLNGGTFTLTGSPNYVANTLSSAITGASASIPLTSVSGFASTGVVTIDREIIIYHGISGSSLINVTRGADGTAAVGHASGAPVGEYICALTSTSNFTNLAIPYQRIINFNVPQQDAWAVGGITTSNAQVDHWNFPTSLSWNFSSLGSGNYRLNSVSVLSNASAYTVGEFDTAGNNLTAARWNGSVWTILTMPTPVSGCTQSLNGISVISSQEGWAVGDQCRVSSGPSRYRYTILKMTNNGNTWQLLSSATTPSIPADNSNANIDNLNAVSVIDTIGNGVGNIGFAVGQAGKVLRYNGTNWVIDSLPGTPNMFAVQTISTQEAWAVGSGGAIRRWNGATWSTFSSPTGTQLNGIAMLDTNNDGLADTGFAVGNNGVIIRYNGSAWTTVTSGTTTTLQGVAMFSSSDAWVVGVNGLARHWDGSTWTSFASGTTGTLYSVGVVDSDPSPSGWQQTFN